MGTRCNAWPACLCLLLMVAPSAVASWGFNIRSDPDHGAILVYRVADASPAAFAGISLGDRLTHVNGQTVATPEAAVMLIRAHDAVDPLALGIRRHDWLGQLTLYALKPVQTLYTLEPGQMRLQKIAQEKSDHGDYAGAAHAYRKAIRAGGPHPVLYYGLGWTLYQLEDHSGSERALMRAVSLAPDDANTMLSAGASKAALGNFEAAKALWRRAAALDTEGDIGEKARENIERANFNNYLYGEGPPSPGRGDGHRAAVRVEPLAALAGQQELTTGLDNLLTRGLTRSGYIQVVNDTGQADVILRGRVVNFDPDAQSVTTSSGLGGIPLFLGQSYSEFHLGIELELLDSATGSRLAKRLINGVSLTTRSSIAVGTTIGKIRLPATLEKYQHTPIERAITDCLQKAVMYSVNVIPESYYK